MTKNIAVLLASVSLFACSGTLRGPVPGAAVDPVKSCAARVVHNDHELSALKGCTAVRGSLYVSGVTSLEPLQQLESLEGSLVVHNNPDLSNLVGLGRLEELKVLRIQNNGIYTAEGLEGLRSVGRLEITNNQRLINIGALNGVTAVTVLTITDNPRLSGYYGVLAGVTRAPWRMDVTNNVGLDASQRSEPWRTGSELIASSR